MVNRWVGSVGSYPGARYAADSASEARKSVDAALDQSYQAKYQAVYEQQLGLWRLAVEHPEMATYILGDSDYNFASVEAAKSMTLDFYVYVYAELAPYDDGGRLPVGLALDGSSVTKPAKLTEEESNGWKSWSYAIADGFRTNACMCEQLIRDADAYDIYFRDCDRQRPTYGEQSKQYGVDTDDARGMRRRNPAER
jgi:hypothetical protein